MPWIRFDCSILDDDFVIELSGDEFKAWALFLLRVKAVGGRGRVKVTSLSNLARNWNVPEKAVRRMLEKAGQAPGARIVEKNRLWYVPNWKKYQEDHKVAKGEFPEDATEARYPPNTTTTPQDTTRQKEKDIVLRRPKAGTEEELKNLDFVLRLHDEEFLLWVRGIRAKIQTWRKGFEWKAGTGSFESDMRGLIYRLSDKKKQSILWDAYNLGQKLNWPDYVERAVKFTVEASGRQPIHNPYGYTMAIIQRPHTLVAEESDNELAKIAEQFTKR